MIEAQVLTDCVLKYNPKSDADLIQAAYEYGKRKHEGQFRRSGEPYFSHPVEVAMILAQQKLDDSTIIRALLHDTIEDTGSTKKDIALAGL